MIIDVLLNIIAGVINVLLFPLEVINIGVDFLAGIPAVYKFLQVVVYILPWSNILPLIVLIIAIFILRIVISLIKTIWDLLPIV